MGIGEVNGTHTFSDLGGAGAAITVTSRPPPHTLPLCKERRDKV